MIYDRMNSLSQPYSQQGNTQSIAYISIPVYLAVEPVRSTVGFFLGMTQSKNERFIHCSSECIRKRYVQFQTVELIGMTLLTDLSLSGDPLKTNQTGFYIISYIN